MATKKLGTDYVKANWEKLMAENRDRMRAAEDARKAERLARNITRHRATLHAEIEIADPESQRIATGWLDRWRAGEDVASIATASGVDSTFVHALVSAAIRQLVREDPPPPPGPRICDMPDDPDSIDLARRRREQQAAEDVRIRL